MALTRKWGIMEKNIISDATRLPYDYTLYCLRDTFLDWKAKEANLSRIYYRGEHVERFFDLRNYFELKKLITTYQFDIVHCCHFKSLWILCTLLRNDSKTILTFYNTRIFHQYFKTFWFRLLSRRIDRFFVCSSEHRSNIFHCFRVPYQKIICLGMGLHFNTKRKTGKDSPFQVSILLGNHERKIQKYDILFYAFPPLLALLQLKGISLRLNFITEHPWPKHTLYQGLQEKTVLFGLDQNVNFIDRSGSDQEDESHLWIDLGEDESISSVSLEALGKGIPTLLARMPFIQGKARYHQGHGETFKQNDPRDLRDKCLKIIEDYPTYNKGAQELSPYLISIHHRDVYEQLLKENLQEAHHDKIRASL